MFRPKINEELFLSSLTPQEKQLLTAESTVVKMKKGQLVFSEDGIAFGCYLLLEGRVKLYKTGVLGKKQIFQIGTPGDMFGFHPILNEHKYPDSAELLEDSTLQFIPSTLFFRLLKSNNDLCICLLRALSNEFESLLGQETMLAQKTVRERVCSVLHGLIPHYQEGEEVFIPLSRNDLADLSGTVKETLVRVLHDLKEENVICTTDSKGTIRIMDLGKLKRAGEID